MKAFDGEQDSQQRNDGDVSIALAEAGSQVVSREYRAPLLAHATMEPMNATALLSGDKLEVWAGNQSPTFALQEAERVTGIPQDNIQIHTTYLGGGFGRRAEMDFIVYAVQVAKKLEGIPVKVTWSREEDMTHDCYRPFAIARMQGVTEGKSVAALDVKNGIAVRHGITNGPFRSLNAWPRRHNSTSRVGPTLHDRKLSRNGLPRSTWYTGKLLAVRRCFAKRLLL